MRNENQWIQSGLDEPDRTFSIEFRLIGLMELIIEIKVHDLEIEETYL